MVAGRSCLGGCLSCLCLDVETLAQGVLHLVQIVAHGLANLEKRQGSVAREFVNGAKREATVGGGLLASLLFGGLACDCLIAHSDA